MCEFIIHKIKNRLCRPEEEIVVQDSKSKSLFFIAEGECLVTVTESEEAQYNVRRLYPGIHFGEIGLLYNIARTATVIAQNYSRLGELGKLAFEEFCDNFPSAQQSLKSASFQYDDPLKMHLKAMIYQVPYFSHLQSEQLDELVFFLEHSIIEVDQFLFLPGTAMDCIYFIVSGEIELSITISDKSLNDFKQKKPAVQLTTLQSLLPGVALQKEQEGLKNLCPFPEVTPIIGLGGVVGHAFPQGQVHSTIAYPQQIIIRRLQRNSILSCYGFPFHEVHQCQAKVTQTLGVYKLTRERMEKLLNSTPGFESLEDAISKLRDQQSNIEIQQMPILDFITEYKVDEDWMKSHDAFKKAVARAIGKNRNIRGKGNVFAQALHKLAVRSKKDKLKGAFGSLAEDVTHIQIAKTIQRNTQAYTKALDKLQDKMQDQIAQVQDIQQFTKDLAKDYSLILEDLQNLNEKVRSKFNVNIVKQ